MTLTKKLTGTLRPIRICGKVEIHLSVLILFCIAVALNFWQTLLVTYAVVIIHELAHIITAAKLGVKADKLEIMPFGVTGRLKTDMISSPSDELKIAAAGPVSNAVMALASIVLYNRAVVSQDTAYYLAALNCCIGILNAVPALPLDGGRMLRAYLTLRLGYIKAYNIAMLVTKLSAAALFAAGIILLFISRFNFSVIMISCFLTANIVSEQRGKSLVLMREILYSRQKLENDGAVSGGVINIMENAPAARVLKKLSYNKFYTVNIIDEDMKVRGCVTETALITALMEKGIRIKAAQLLEE